MGLCTHHHKYRRIKSTHVQAVMITQAAANQQQTMLIKNNALQMGIIELCGGK